MILDLSVYFKYDPKSTSNKRNNAVGSCDQIDKSLLNLYIDYEPQLDFHMLHGKLRAKYKNGKIA